MPRAPANFTSKKTRPAAVGDGADGLTSGTKCDGKDHLDVSFPGVDVWEHHRDTFNDKINSFLCDGRNPPKPLPAPPLAPAPACIIDEAVGITLDISGEFKEVKVSLEGSDRKVHLSWPSSDGKPIYGAVPVVAALLRQDLPLHELHNVTIIATSETHADRLSNVRISGQDAPPPSLAPACATED